MNNLRTQEIDAIVYSVVRYQYYTESDTHLFYIDLKLNRKVSFKKDISYEELMKWFAEQYMDLGEFNFKKRVNELFKVPEERDNRDNCF